MLKYETARIPGVGTEYILLGVSIIITDQMIIENRSVDWERYLVMKVVEAMEEIKPLSASFATLSTLELMIPIVKKMSWHDMKYDTAEILTISINDYSDPWTSWRTRSLPKQSTYWYVGNMKVRYYAS